MFKTHFNKINFSSLYYLHLILILLNFSIILLPYYYPRRYESYITDKLYENVDNKWVYNSNVVNKKFFVNEAKNIKDNLKYLKFTKIISEDDILNSLIVLEPKFMKKALSILAFHVKSEEEKIIILKNFDYIYLSKRRYGYYYLQYYTKFDKFGEVIKTILLTNKSSMYNDIKLDIVDNTIDYLILKIEY